MGAATFDFDNRKGGKRVNGISVTAFTNGKINRYDYVDDRIFNHVANVNSPRYVR